MYCLLSLNAIYFFLYGGLTFSLILSCHTDLSYRKIPNLLTYPTILVALLLQYMLGGVGGFLFSLSGAVCGFFIFLFPYLMGGMGAGDVKLMAAVGAVLGPAHTAMALLFIALAGGIFAISLMLRRRILKETVMRVLHSAAIPGYMREKAVKDKKDGIPYALAITGGVFMFFVYMLMENKNLSLLGL